MPGKVRRIVTANKKDGRSYILSDMRLPTGDVPEGEPIRAGIWMTRSGPASNTDETDPAPEGIIYKTAPPDRGGSVIRIVDIFPSKVRPYDPSDLQARG